MAGGTDPGRAREHWDVQAALYGAGAGERRFGRFLALYEEACWRYIGPLLPRPGEGLILEAGCGAGRWVLRLAPLGHRLVLADLSPEMVRQARARVERLGLAGQVEGYHVLDICDLRALGEAGFDLVLALGGPLSLCRDARMAAAELARVARPGGHVICDAANRYRTALDLLLAREPGPLGALLETGQFVRPDGLTDHRFTPQEFAALFERQGMVVRHLTAAPPLLAYLPSSEEARLVNDERTFALMQDVASRLGEDPSVIGLSGRLLVVAQKP